MKKRNFLIIEDDASLQPLIEAACLETEMASAIHWETSVEGAYQRLNGETQYDFVVLDIFLGGEETGVDLYRYCLKQFPGLPILIMSSLELSGYFLLLGDDTISAPFLQKPFRLSEFTAMVSGLLNYSKNSEKVGSLPRITH